MLAIAPLPSDKSGATSALSKKAIGLLAASILLVICLLSKY
jgi:hypothetical protein